MKKCLITGGTGFVGANLVRRLLQEGHEVHLLVRAGYKSWRIDDIRQDIVLHEASLTDVEGLNTLLKSIRPDWIFHLATHGAYSWQQNTQEILQTNFMGTVHLLEAALKVGFDAFINTGSSSEYGIKAHPPNEEAWLDPNSDYAVAKASATLHCRQTALKHQAPVSTLRLYSVYGPYEEPNRLMPALVLAGLQQQLPPLVDPLTARDFIYIEDVLDVYLQVAQKSDLPYGCVFNVGTGRQSTLQDLVEIARNELNIATEPVWGSMPQRSWDATTWQANIDRLKQTFNWEPRYALEEGFRETVQWFKAHPHLLPHYGVEPVQ